MRHLCGVNASRAAVTSSSFSSHQRKRFTVLRRSLSVTWLKPCASPSASQACIERMKSVGFALRGDGSRAAIRVVLIRRRDGDLGGVIAFGSSDVIEGGIT